MRLLSLSGLFVHKEAFLHEAQLVPSSDSTEGVAHSINFHLWC